MSESVEALAEKIAGAFDGFRDERAELHDALSELVALASRTVYVVMGEMWDDELYVFATREQADRFADARRRPRGWIREEPLLSEDFVAAVEKGFR